MKPHIKKQKGFTIIELVVVIAVIAILAAVLIPTFSDVVDKAATSADIQLANTANTVLAAMQAYGDKITKDSADAELKANGIDMDVAPSNKNNVFYYLGDEERYIVFDTAAKKIVYPQDIAEKYKDKQTKDWLINELTLDFGVNKEFTTDTDTDGFKQYVDTGVCIDWNKDFRITEKLNIASLDGITLAFGNWNSKDDTQYTIDVVSTGTVELWVGTRIKQTQTVTAGNADLVFEWQHATRRYSLIIKQNDKKVIDYNGNISNTPTNSQYPIRIGAVDHSQKDQYQSVTVQSFAITYRLGYDETIALPEAKSNINGYDSNGWFDSAASGNKINGSFVMPAANTTVYAQWTQ